MRKTTTTVAMIAAVAASIAMAPTSQAALAPAAPAPAPAAPRASRQAALGKTVFLDPGHQGIGCRARLEQARPRWTRRDQAVPDLRGDRCQRVPEHTVNWQVAQLVKGALESQGARVVLSRPNDTGWAGASTSARRRRTVRALPWRSASTPILSSRGSDPGKSGFHMIVPKLPVPDKKADEVQRGEGRKASNLMRDSFKNAGFSPSNYGVRSTASRSAPTSQGPTPRMCRWCSSRWATWRTRLRRKRRRSTTVRCATPPRSPTAR